LHFNICQEIGGKLDTKHRYDHVPKLVPTDHDGKVTILWKQQFQTDRTVPNNKPDSIMCGNKQGTCMSINVAITGDRNVIKTEGKRILTHCGRAMQICVFNTVKLGTSASSP